MPSPFPGMNPYFEQLDHWRQEPLHRTYDGPGYEHYIYRGEPEPSLSPVDAAWARPFVPATG
jgi:hypothetical protein